MIAVFSICWKCLCWDERTDWKYNALKHFEVSSRAYVKEYILDLSFVKEGDKIATRFLRWYYEISVKKENTSMKLMICSRTLDSVRINWKYWVGALRRTASLWTISNRVRYWWNGQTNRASMDLSSASLFAKTTIFILTPFQIN